MVIAYTKGWPNGGEQGPAVRLFHLLKPYAYTNGKLFVYYHFSPSLQTFFNEDMH